MNTSTIVESHKNEIDGVLTCLDRIVIHGTLQGVGYAGGMTGFLYSENRKIFDYPKFAGGLRDELRTHVQHMAKTFDVEIEHIRKHRIRKLDKVKETLGENEQKTGLVAILSAMEGCPAFTPWHDKKTKKTYLKYTTSQCLHYYFYFVDDLLGLCSLRVPTWAPFGIQFFCNGHNILANQLRNEGIDFHMLDNSFDHIADYSRAQELASQFPVAALEARLNAYAEICCPVYKRLSSGYHWSVKQLECATDIVFKQDHYLQDIYPDLLNTIMRTVTVQDVATFLGKRVTKAFNDEAGSRYNVLFEGARVKHRLGPNCIKIYDKFKRILRIETTSNDVSKFKIFRRINRRDGTSEMANASAPKAIAFIGQVMEKLTQANNRYLKHISAFKECKVGRKKLAKVTNRVVENNRSYKGFNFFDSEDAKALETIMRGEMNIGGFSNRDIRTHLPGKNSGQVSRLIKRMRLHGLLKKVAHSYKYYVTDLGREVIASVLQIKEIFLTESLC